MNLSDAYEIVEQHMTDFLNENFNQRAFPHEAIRIRQALRRFEIAAGEELLPLSPEERNYVEKGYEF